MKGITPLIYAPKGNGKTALFAESTTSPKDISAWAYERPDGGRAFVFTGLHSQRYFKDRVRKLTINGILWAASSTAFTRRREGGDRPGGVGEECGNTAETDTETGRGNKRGDWGRLSPLPPSAFQSALTLAPARHSSATNLKTRFRPGSAATSRAPSRLNMTGQPRRPQKSPGQMVGFRTLTVARAKPSTICASCSFLVSGEITRAHQDAVAFGTSAPDRGFF